MGLDRRLSRASGLVYLFPGSMIARERSIAFARLGGSGAPAGELRGALSQLSAPSIA
jgi:hypothetical protein